MYDLNVRLYLGTWTRTEVGTLRLLVGLSGTAKHMEQPEEFTAEELKGSHPGRSHPWTPC